MAKRPTKVAPKRKAPKLVKAEPEQDSAQHTADLIRKALRNVEDRLESNEIKATVGDFIRLVQLEKELEELKGRPTEIKITWVETESESATDE